MTIPASNVERFSRGEAIAVGVDRIEKELAGLWQAAGRASSGAGDSPGGPSPVARAALWNIVIPTHGAASLVRTKKMVDELAPSLPARVIMLARVGGSDDGGGGDGAGGGGSDGIEATIESNVVSRPNGARLVCSEEITLIGNRGADDHFGALVRSLQIPGLPTATFWIDSTAMEELLTRDLLPLSDRLVLNTGVCGRLGDLVAVARLAGNGGRTQVGDLGWLRLANFRLLFAGLFDPPVGGAPLYAARRVTIEHRPGRATSALMLGAWLGCQLGWNVIDGAATPETARFRFAPSPGRGGPAGAAEAEPARPLELELRASTGECGTSGMVSITLETAGGESYAVRRTADNHAEITIPIAPPRSVKLDSRSDAELCVGALGPGGRDPLLTRVLAYAGRLAELVGGRDAG